MLSIGIMCQRKKHRVHPIGVQHTRKGCRIGFAAARRQRRLPIIARCPLCWRTEYSYIVNSLRMKRFCFERVNQHPYGLAYWQELRPDCRRMTYQFNSWRAISSMLFDFNALCLPVCVSDHAGRHKHFVLRYRPPFHILEMGETRFRKDCQMGGKKGYRNRGGRDLCTAQNGILCPRCRHYGSDTRSSHTVTRDYFNTDASSRQDSAGIFSRARNALHRGHAGSASDCGDRRCPTLSQQAGSHRTRHRCAAVPVRQIRANNQAHISSGKSLSA